MPISPAARREAVERVDSSIRRSLAATLARLDAQLVRSRELRASVRPVLDETRTLIARSRRLRRRICGGSDLDTPQIIEIIRKSRVCVECLIRRTGIPDSRISDALHRLGTHITLLVSMDRCHDCLRLTQIYGLPDGDGTGQRAHPSAAPARPPLTQNEAVWRFLEAHRGQMFCTQCIAQALSAARRIDRAVIGAEGRGARRQHGLCTRCGKDRLLCGLAE